MLLTLYTNGSEGTDNVNPGIAEKQLFKLPIKKSGTLRGLGVTQLVGTWAGEMGPGVWYTSRRMPGP
jgi:hypothetical protein